MDVTFDPGKDAANLAKHGISLSRAAEFDLGAAIITVDDRFNYGEVRYRAFAYLDGEGRCLAFTITDLAEIRVISFRRARQKEMKRYGL